MIPTNKTSSTLASASHSETEDAASLTANVHSNPKVDPSRKTYAELDLPPELHRALADLNFIHPTPIQEKAIPIALTGQDIIGCAATGTGKTAAFLIPLLTKLIDEPEATALVLLPTRELALQVGEVHHDLTKYLRGMGAVTLIGGVAMGNQLKGLARRPRLIVATPGRLLDHLGRNSVSLKKLGFLVLDEADRMLDMGFQPQLREILRYLPHERQTMLFSATLPANILELSSKYLVDPARVDIKGAPTLDGKPAEPQKLNIAESTVQVEQKEKNETLLDELNAREGSVLVFARTQSRVDRVCRYLESYDISVARIHGGRTQGQRVRALDGFRDGSTRVLIATDLASRGIDIDHVAHVINFDLPQAPEDYVHRIGRTGRAGRSGQAVSFVTREDAPMWRAIERLKSGVESIGPPGANAPRSGRPSGGGEGRRNSRPNSRDGGGPRGAGRNGARSSERGRGGNPSNVSARDREQASTRREQAEFSPRARAEPPTSDRGFTDRPRGERSDGRGPTFNANSNPNSRGGESGRRDSGPRTTSDRSPPRIAETRPIAGRTPAETRHAHPPSVPQIVRPNAEIPLVLRNGRRNETPNDLRNVRVTGARMRKATVHVARSVRVTARLSDFYVNSARLKRALCGKSTQSETLADGPENRTPSTQTENQRSKHITNGAHMNKYLSALAIVGALSLTACTDKKADQTPTPTETTSTTTSTTSTAPAATPTATPSMAATPAPSAAATTSTTTNSTKTTTAPANH